MKFMFLGPMGAPHDSACFEEMGKFAADVASQGILRRGAPLARDSDAATVHYGDRGRRRYSALGALGFAEIVVLREFRRIRL